MNINAEYTSVEKRLLRLAMQVMENHPDKEFSLKNDGKGLCHIQIADKDGQLLFDHVFSGDKFEFQQYADEDIIPAIGYYLGCYVEHEFNDHRNQVRSHRKQSPTVELLRLLDELRFKFYDEELFLLGSTFPLPKLDLFCPRLGDSF